MIIFCTSIVSGYVICGCVTFTKIKTGSRCTATSFFEMMQLCDIYVMFYLQ